MMICKVCGRTDCTGNFHSFQEQDTFDMRKKMSLELETLRRKNKALRYENAKLHAELLEAKDEAGDEWR